MEKTTSISAGAKKAQWKQESHLEAHTPVLDSECARTCLLNEFDAQLKHYTELPENWDGYGALPVDDVVAENTRLALNTMSDTQLMHWAVRPNNNGSLLMVPKCGSEEYATICIGRSGLTYAAILKDGTKLKGMAGFTLDNIKKTIDLINDKLDI